MTAVSWPFYFHIVNPYTWKDGLYIDKWSSDQGVNDQIIPESTEPSTKRLIAKMHVTLEVVLEMANSMVWGWHQDICNHHSDEIDYIQSSHIIIK